MNIRSENKVRILHLVSQLPGIHLRELQRTLGVSFNSVRYNAELLSKSGEIILEKSSGYSRLYPLGTTEKDKMAFSVIRNKTTRRLLLELTKEPMLTNKELTERAGLAKSTVSEHIHELLLAGIVHLTLSDGGFKVELQDPAFIQSLITSSEKYEHDKDVVESFADLWDF